MFDAGHGEEDGGAGDFLLRKRWRGRPSGYWAARRKTETNIKMIN